MSNPPPLPSRLPPKLIHPKPSPTATNSPKYSDSFSSSGESGGPSVSPHSRRPPVAPRKPQPPAPRQHSTAPAPDVNGSTATGPPPPIVIRGAPPVIANDGGEGFGHCLQQGYEAITKKHEDELLALESLRGHIFHRARADKEYSESLIKMNQKATKKIANIDQSSAVVKVQAEY